MHNLSRPWILAVAIFILGLSAPLTYAQQSHTKMMRIGGEGIEGQPVTLEELGAIVAQKENRLEVLFVMPPDQRPAAYRKIDVQAEDLVLMVNGMRTKTIDDLKAALDGIAVGEEIQLGLKRDMDMTIATYTKADPDELPEQRRMIMKVEDDGADQPKMTFKMEGDNEGPVVLLAGSGLLAGEGESGPIIGFIMPVAAEMLGDADVQKGDGVKSLQGETISDVAQLSELWDDIEVGDKVELMLTRGDLEFAIKFAKQEAVPPGKMMMIKE